MSFAKTPAPAAVDVTPSNRRFLIMALLFVTVVINYLDRSNLSIAAPSITNEFGLNPVQLGVVFSAFGWTYTPLQIPGGWLVDRVHPRMLYPLTIFFWSIATLCLGLSTGLVMLIILRMTVGLFEVPSFLINNRIATTWFGERERATCIAVYTSAEFVGLAFLTPLLAWLKVTFGWPAIFFFTGALGLAWSFVFRRSLPRSSGVPWRQSGRDRVDPLKRRHPRSVQPDHGAACSARWFAVARLLGRARPAQAVGHLFRPFRLGHHVDVLSDLVSDLPRDLSAPRLHQGGFYASLPFLGAFAGVLCSGALSDWLYRRGFSLSFARKTPIIGGLALSTSIIGANFVDHPALIILFLSLAFFANGLASIHWSLVSATAPERLIGLTSGVFNGVGGLAGITAPIIIGWLLRGGDFTRPLTFIACIALLGACSYIFVVGKLERVKG